MAPDCYHRENSRVLNSNAASASELKCPRCTRPVSQAEAYCPECGYSLAVTDDVFGADIVLLHRVTDAVGVLSEADRARLEAAVCEFETVFPQLFAVVYIGALPKPASLRQFGFWLLNRAAVCELEATRPNENGALLLIDVHGRSAALVCGYFLECYVRERDAAAVLRAGRQEFMRSDWAAGVLAAVEELTRRLRRRVREAAKAPAKFAPARPPAVPVRPQFARIRDGHTKPESLGQSTDQTRQRL